MSTYQINGRTATVETRAIVRGAACQAAQLALCAAILAQPDPYEQAERDAAERRQWEAGLAGALAGESEGAR